MAVLVAIPPASAMISFSTTTQFATTCSGVRLDSIRFVGLEFNRGLGHRCNPRAKRLASTISMYGVCNFSLTSHHNKSVVVETGVRRWGKKQATRHESSKSFERWREREERFWNGCSETASTK